VIGYARRFKFSHVKRDRVGKLCLATGHQQPLLTNCCSLWGGASRTKIVTFSKHYSLIYVLS